MVPQIKAALYEIYTRHKQINKQANNQPHTKTHIKLSGKEARSKTEGRMNGWRRRRIQEANKQKKMWEKRLNENYFKLFRRRNGRSEGDRLRTEECSKMAATGRRKLAAICTTDSGDLCEWRRRDVNAETLSSSSKADRNRNGQTREPFSVC